MAKVVAKSHFELPVQLKLKHKEKLLLEFSPAVNQDHIYNGKFGFPSEETTERFKDVNNSLVRFV